MGGPQKGASAIRDAILHEFPRFQYAALPPSPLFGDPPADPDVFPDGRRDRGYYVPIPAPPGLRVQEVPSVKILGERFGRQWRVDILYLDSQLSQVPPTIQIQSVVRLLGPDVVPGTVLPWLVAAADPGEAKRIVWSSRGVLNLVGRQARQGIGRAGVLRGRPLAGIGAPPVRGRYFADAWHPAVAQFLHSPSFQATYARWQERSGEGWANSGPMFPAVAITADRFRVSTGVNPSAPPSEHAATLREAMSLVDQLERLTTGLDPQAAPMPMEVFRDPPGSVPEYRPTYACPKCGQPEILRRVSPPQTGVVQFLTLRCGAPVFPQMWDRMSDVSGMAKASIGA